MLLFSKPGPQGATGDQGDAGDTGPMGPGIDPGVIAYFGMAAAPSGWLAADGSTVSRTTYDDLFAAIGTTFGVGDGSTTFVLPDLRGEFIRGLDGGRGVDTGRTLGSTQAEDLAAHTHGFTQYQGSGGSVSDAVAKLEQAGAGGDDQLAKTFTTAASGGTETRPRNLALLACIKT